MGTHIRKIEKANRQTSFHLKSTEDKCVLWPLYGKPGNSVFVMFHEHCSLIQFLKIYGLWEQGQEAGGHCHLNQCMTPLQRPSQGAGALAPHCHAVLVHRDSEGQAAGPLGCGMLSHAQTIWSHLILPLPHLLQIFFSSHWPSKISTLKKMHRKAYPKAASWEEWCYKDKSSIITMGFFQPLKFI